jgi:hypothetical protein
VVSYDVFRTVVPDDAERCRAGTHPDPCAAVTETNSGHSVSRWPTSSGSQSAPLAAAVVSPVARPGSPAREIVW